MAWDWVVNPCAWVVMDWAIWRRSSLFSPLIKGGELTRPLSSLTSSPRGGTWLPRRVALHWKSYHQVFVSRNFKYLLPIITIKGLNSKITCSKYSRGTILDFKESMFPKHHTSSYFINLVCFTIMGKNLHRRCSERHWLKDIQPHPLIQSLSHQGSTPYT